MARNALWTAIRDTLSEEIGRGRYGPGDRLPTEAQLAGRFGVNRHTVRRALAALAGDGLVHARRGAGAFVTHTPTDYPLGRRVRFHQSLEAAGRSPGRQALLLATRAADGREASALDLPDGAQVHVYEGLSTADGQPIALFRSVFPAERFPGLLDHLRRNPSVTAAFAAEGLRDYIRAETRLTAKAASATQAQHLRLTQGAPLLRAIAVNLDESGIPVEYGRTWFAGDRVTLTVGNGRSFGTDPREAGS